MHIRKETLFLALSAATAALWLNHPLAAAWVWTTTIAFMHAGEETAGELWAYFGQRTNVPFLEKVSKFWGFVLIVAPAAVLQAFASFNAFTGGTVAVFWLAMLIGARLSDGLFSHWLPFAQSWGSKDNAMSNHDNPGLPTACVYIVDGLILLAVFQTELAANRLSTLLGVVIGAGFFLLVQPGLRLLGSILRRQSR